MPGAEVAFERDTDAGWRELGLRDPCWAVLSSPEFLSENTTPEWIEEFYRPDRYHIDPIAEELTRPHRGEPTLADLPARLAPGGMISKHDYDLSHVPRLVNQAGIEEMSLVSTDHDGRHGVIILGRKTAEPYQS